MFRKRETISQNIAFMALMSAINVVLVLLTTFIPYLFIFLMLFLPLCSTLVWLFCKKKYFIIYVIATIATCLFVNAFAYTDTIFYVIPSILSGLVFGLLIEKKFSLFYILFLSSLVQIGITYLSLPLIKLIYDIDTISYFLSIFKLESFEYKDVLPPLFIYVISIIQTGLSMMVIKEEINKLGIEINENQCEIPVIYYSYIASIILSIIFIFIYKPLSFLLFAISIYFSIYILFITLSKPKKITYLVIAISFVMTFILFPLYVFIKNPFGIYLIGVFFVIFNGYSFFQYYLEKLKKKHTIK